MNGLKTYFIVGFKAVIGSILSIFIMWLFSLIVGAIAFFTTNTAAMIVLLILTILLNVLVIGWVYNTFWKWK